MRKRARQIAAGEAEIASMTRDLHELHHDVGVPAMEEAVAGWREGLRGTASRRTFLLGAGGAVAGVGVMAAMSAAPGLGSVAAAAGSAGTSPEAGLHGTLKIAALAASLENLAVFAYGAALTAASAGKLGTVPPAVAQFATTVKQQHAQHAAAWNSLLTSAGKKKVTVTDPTLTPKVKQMFAAVTDVTGVAQLALTLENVAAQTYQAEASKLKSEKAIAVAATIQPVEMQHAAILYYVLGEYPGVQDASGTPVAFSPTTQAA